MKKVAVLGLYATALYFVLRRYYANGNQGIPSPAAIAAPTYLYAIVALASDFFGPGAVFLGAGLTVAMIWDVQKNPTAGVNGSSNSSPSGFSNTSPSSSGNSSGYPPLVKTPSVYDPTQKTSKSTSIVPSRSGVFG